LHVVNIDVGMEQCSQQLTLGPMKLRPWSLQISTKVAFSARKP